MHVFTYMLFRFSALFVLLMLPFAAPAQEAPVPASTTSGITTRVLAIGHITAGTTRDKVMTVLGQEVRDTVRLYLGGKIDQWFARRDQNGVVFLMNVETVAEARALLDRLPLGQAKMMEFDLIPLGPLTPLGLLLQENAGAAK